MDSWAIANKRVYYSISKCASEWRKWMEVNVSRSDTAGIAARRRNVQIQAQDVAKKSKPGWFVIVQTRTDTTDRYALGVFVDAGYGSPIRKTIRNASERIEGSDKRFSRGDVAVALRFFVRKEGDGERRTFTDTLEEGATQLCSVSEMRFSWPANTKFISLLEDNDSRRVTRGTTGNSFEITPEGEQEIFNALW